ncbi:MAG: flagellar biosynthesis anti-sigma factor FlgM [Desulfobacterales bacterium]|nr:flagellar biosynthesis anti-sigma factor FlgM [Desulfobacterales bacterium]
MVDLTNITEYAKQTYINKAGNSKRPSASDKTVATSPLQQIKKQDVVSLSEGSKEMQIAKKAIDSEGEDRMEKLDQLRQQIRSGKYEINARQIAEKMIGGFVSEIA